MSEFDQVQIRRIDGTLLLVFRELLRRRRATAVADHLGLSPSAISHTLGRLRDLFGDPLFTRRPHGLEPTQRALDLAPRIEAAIEAIGHAVSPEPAFDPARTRRRFRIACPEHVPSIVGARLAETFRRQAPMATFATRYAVLDRALAALRRGEIDVAIGVFQRIPRGFEGTRLFEDDYCVIARRGHPEIGEALDLRSYARIGHVFVGTPDGALSDEPAWDRAAVDAAYGSIPRPDVVRTHAYVSLWETAMLMVAASDLIADCPRRLAQACGPTLGLQILEPPFPPFRFAMDAVRRTSPQDAGVDWLIGALREACL